MALVGANVAALRQLGASFGEGSERLDLVVATLDAAIENADWSGPDAEQFRDLWLGQLRATVIAAAGALVSAGKTVRSNADAQEVTSTADGGPAGAVTALGAVGAAGAALAGAGGAATGTSAAADDGTAAGPIAAAPALGAAGSDDNMCVAVPEWWQTTDLSTLTPEEIREQWDILTDAERRSVIASNPMVIGNLDGIPLGWRSLANEYNVRAEITRLEGEIEDLKSLRSIGRKDMLPDTQERISELQKQIDYYEKLLKPAAFDPDKPDTWRTAYYDPDGNLVGAGDGLREGWPRGTQLILFDPENKRIASYHGVFDDNGDIHPGYDNVTTLVPGTGTQPWKWGGPDLRGAQLHVDANMSGNGSEAMIVYSDGAQPQNLNAIAPRFAQDMGPKLTQFSDTYVPEGATYTVVGHSYGATIVAQAEATGLSADRILYVAPAGYGEGPRDWQHRPEGNMIRGLEDFPNTGDKPHYVMISRRDPVVGAIQFDNWWQDGGIHGRTPTNDPNVTRLETGFRWTAPAGSDPDGHDRSAGYLDDLPGSHSTVFEYKTTAHQNMVQVITGGTAEGWGGRNTLAPIDPHTPEEWDEAIRRSEKKDEDDWPDVDIQ